MRKIYLISFIIIFINQAFSQDSLNMSLAYQWKDTTLIPSGFFGNTYNEIWGFVQNGREYAVIGSTEGTHIFDVTNPINSTMVDFVRGTHFGFETSQIVHRDFHDYNGYLYMVSDEGSSSLQIADLSYLPDSVSLVYESNSFFSRAHNIFIDSATAHLYALGTNQFIEILDISNPGNPILLFESINDAPAWGSTVGYVHDAYVRNDTAYLNGEDGLYIVDFNDMNNPQLIGSLTTYEQSGYNHSGWLHENGTVYALGDETHGMDVKLLDVSNLSNIQLIDTIDNAVNPNLSIPHNQVINGNILYVSYYYDGVYAFDITDPQNAFITGYYDTSPIPNGLSYKGNWGVYPFLPSGTLLASDMQEGLFVINQDKIISVNEIKEKEERFKIYPNPTTNYFTILNLHENSFDFNLAITDISGKLVYETQLNLKSYEKNKIELPITINSGIYFVKMWNNRYLQTEKLMLLK